MTVDHGTIHAVATALAQLPGIVTDLEVDLVAATRQPLRRTKPASRPPLDLTVVSDIDDTWNALTTWLRDWCDTLHLAGPATWTWDTVCGWLATHWPSAAERHPAAADFADELLHRHTHHCPDRCRLGWHPTLRHHHADRPERAWRPLPGRWTCPVADTDTTCGGVLAESTAARVIACQANPAHRWEGEAEYERLGRILGCETAVTIEQAATLARVHRSTIYRWITDGTLPVTDLDGVQHVDTRDLAIIAARRAAAR